MAKRSVTNKSQTALNRARFNWWRAKLVDYYLTAFKWDGFPFEKNNRYQIEMYLNELFLDGACVGFCYTDDTKAIPIVGAVNPNSGYNWFGGATTYTITNKIASYVKRADEIAIGWNCPTHRPMYFTIDHYAQVLADIDGLEDVNLKAQNTPAVIRAPHGQELTYSNAYEQIAGHKPVVYGREDLMSDEREWFYPPTAPYLCDKFELLKHDIINDYFNEIGVTSKTVEKRAQLLVDEINIDRESISLTKNSFLDARTQFCDSINELFGLDVSCEFNVDLYPREFTDTRYENTNSSSLGKGGYRETIEKDEEARQKKEVQ